MNILWEKLYFRAQSLYFFLQMKMLKQQLGLSAGSDYRIDLLKTMQTVKGSISGCDAFIDIGANKGEFARIFGDLFPLSTLVCVEPNDKLNEDIRRNNLRPTPIIVNKAVSDKAGEMEFFLHTDSQMSSLFASNDELIQRDFGEDNASQVIRKMVGITTLDEIFNEYSAQLAHKKIFLKIDTQGNELDVLRGGANSLGKIRYCLLEYMFHTPYEVQYPFDRIIQQMSDCGFECLGPMHASYRVKGEIGAVLFLFGNTKVTI
jgi:FkbM family methyltransferase